MQDHSRGASNPASNRNDLFKRLNDAGQSFTEAELDAIIHSEFFKAQALDSEIVDAALTRRMQLSRISLDAVSIQKERERMIYEILKEIFNAGA